MEEGGGREEEGRQGGGIKKLTENCISRPRKSLKLKLLAPIKFISFFKWNQA